MRRRDVSYDGSPGEFVVTDVSGQVGIDRADSLSGPTHGQKPGGSPQPGVFKIAEHAAGFQQSANHRVDLLNVRKLEGRHRQTGYDKVVNALAFDLLHGPPYQAYAAIAQRAAKGCGAQNIAFEDIREFRLELANIEFIPIGQDGPKMSRDRARARSDFKNPRGPRRTPKWLGNRDGNRP